MSLKVHCHACHKDTRASIYDESPRCAHCDHLLFEAMALRQRAGLDEEDAKEKKQEAARQRRIKKKEDEMKSKRHKI